jgi:hypothetical protein
MVFGFGIVLIFVWSPWLIFVKQRAIFWNKLNMLLLFIYGLLYPYISPPLVVLVGALP